LFPHEHDLSATRTVAENCLRTPLPERARSTLRG
jgi:hypothetical protein